MEERDLAGGEVLPGLAGRCRAFEQRVVDVGHVLHVVDLDTGVAPRPVEQIEPDVGGRVTQVRRVVGRDTADVDRRDAPVPTAILSCVAVSQTLGGRPTPGSAARDVDACGAGHGCMPEL